MKRKHSPLRGTYKNPAAAVAECARRGAESPGEIYSCALRSMPKTRADAWAREAKRLSRAAAL